MVPIIWNMETYFLKCKKHTDDIDSKKNNNDSDK